MSALATSTGERYKEASSNFKLEMERRGLAWETMAEEEQDWTLAEYLVEQSQANEPRQRPWALCLVSALQKVAPGRRLKTSWKVVDAWAIKNPSTQALPCPQEVALACGVWLVVNGRAAEGTALVLCFCGLLRISEALSLSLRDIFFSTEGFRPVCILLLSKTKRGREQRVVLVNEGVILWVKSMIKLRSFVKASKDEKLLPTTYKRVSADFKRACKAFGLLPVWTSHSLRRGGATQLLINQWPIENIMEFGRWASVTSAKLYLRRGEVALLRCRGDFSEELEQRLAVVSSIGARVFRLASII